jgi:hypothetical protein
MKPQLQSTCLNQKRLFSLSLMLGLLTIGTFPFAQAQEVKPLANKKFVWWSPSLLAAVSMDWPALWPTT